MLTDVHFAFLDSSLTCLYTRDLTSSLIFRVKIPQKLYVEGHEKGYFVKNRTTGGDLGQVIRKKAYLFDIGQS